MVEPDAVGIVRQCAEVVDHQAGHRDRAIARGLHFLDVGPHHHARQRSGGFRAGIACRDLLAESEDGGRIAEPFHLFQFVTDVEHGAAFGLQALQHDKELIRFLRREHGGRLVKDQKLWVLHQNPDDLDPLAFADRELPDLAFGIERQAVVPRYLREPRRHLPERFAGGKPERHVLGHRQIVEQREVLKHHADAQRPRRGRPRQFDRLSGPAQFAAAGLDQAINHLHQGRLAGAVFAEQGVDLARSDIEIDRIIGEKTAVSLGDADRLEKRQIASSSCGGRCVRHRSGQLTG